MDTNNKYSEMDDLFRSKIKDRLEKSDWNTPPKLVLRDALAQIEEKESNNRTILIYAFLLAFFILGAFCLSLFNNHKIQKIDEKIDHIITFENNETSIVSKSNSNLINKSHQKKTNEINNFTAVNQRSNNKLKIEKEINNNAAIFPIKNKLKIKKINSDNNSISKTNTFNSQLKSPPMVSQNQKSNDAITSNILNASQTIINANILTVDKRPSTIGETISEKIEMPNNLNKLPFTQLLSNKNPFITLHDSNIIQQPIEIITPKKNKKLYPFILAGINFSSFSMSSPTVLSDQLKSYDNNYLGYQTALGINQPMSKRIALKYSLSYTKIRNKSLYQSSMIYDENKVHTDINGVSTYTDIIDLESPLGISSRSVNMGLSENLSNGEELMNHTHFVNGFHLLSINFGLEHTIFKRDKISLALNGGFSTNYVLGMDQDVNTYTYLDTKLLNTDTYRDNSKDALNSLFFSAQLGGTIKYNLADNFYLGLNLAYDQSLGSVRKVNPLDQVKTNIKSMFSSLQFGWRF